MITERPRPTRRQTAPIVSGNVVEPVNGMTAVLVLEPESAGTVVGEVGPSGTTMLSTSTGVRTQARLVLVVAAAAVGVGQVGGGGHVPSGQRVSSVESIVTTLTTEV